MLEFKLPSAVVKQFENGLTLIHFHRTDIPKVYFRLGIRGGEKMDFSEPAGSVGLMSGMMKKGTKTRTYNEFAEAVDFTGGSLGASASKDFFYGQGEFLSEFASDGLALMSDMFRNPIFPEEQFQRDRDRSIADLENEKSSSGYIGRKFMTRQLYSPHPYGLSATADSLSSVTADSISALHARTIGPKDAFLVISGDVEFDEAVRLAGEMFGDWEAQEASAIDFPEKQYKPDVLLVDRPGSVQSSVSFGVPLFPRTDERYIRTLLSNQILGGGSSGRLFLTLREEKGLTYGAYSSMDVYVEAGSWIASAEVRGEATGEAIDGFMEEFDKIRSTEPTADELNSAKRYLAGAFPLRCETPAGMANLFLLQSLYGFPEDHWNSYLEAIEDVTTKDVLLSATEFLVDERMQVVIVGDAKTVLPQLGRYSTIRIVDIDGNEK